MKHLLVFTLLVLGVEGCSPILAQDKKISALTGATTPLAGSEVLPIVQSGSTVKVSAANLTAGRAVSASSLTATTVYGTTFDTSVDTSKLTISGKTISAGGTDTSVDVIITPESGGDLLLTTGNFIATGNGNIIAVTHYGTTFDTSVDASKLTISGTTIAAGGTDTSVDVTITPESGGDLVLSTGNLVLANTKGIDFTASSGNVLNQYITGSWTPTIVSGGTISSASGRYHKIGTLVLVTGAFNLDTMSASTLVVGSVPYSAAAGVVAPATATRLEATTTEFETGTVDGTELYLVFTSSTIGGTRTLRFSAFFYVAD